MLQPRAGPSQGASGFLCLPQAHGQAACTVCSAQVAAALSTTDRRFKCVDDRDPSHRCVTDVSIASCFQKNNSSPAGRRKGKAAARNGRVAPTWWRFSWGFPAFKLLAVLMTQCRSSRLPPCCFGLQIVNHVDLPAIHSKAVKSLPLCLRGPVIWPQWIPPGSYILLTTSPPWLPAYVRLGGSSSKYPIRIPSMAIHRPNYPSVPFARDNLILHSSRRTGVLGLRGWEFPPPPVINPSHGALAPTREGTLIGSIILKIHASLWAIVTPSAYLTITAILLWTTAFMRFKTNEQAWLSFPSHMRYKHVLVTRPISSSCKMCLIWWNQKNAHRSSQAPATSL